MEDTNQKKKYDVILFDLDGTLTDPKVGIVNSIQYALSKFGLDEKNPDLLVSFIGAPLFECLRKQYSLDETQAEQVVGFYREYYSDVGMYENSVYAGIPELLNELNQHGNKLIVATLKPTVFAERVLRHFHLHACFSFVVGGRPDRIGSSKTEIIEQALSRLTGVERRKIVMVGDRKHDIIGARNNGIDSIAVTYGYGTIEELQNEGPTHVARSLESLRALLKTAGR